MSNTSDIRNGLCIKHNHDIYKIIEFLHVKPGKGPAFVRTKLKSLLLLRFKQSAQIRNFLKKASKKHLNNLKWISKVAEWKIWKIWSLRSSIPQMREMKEWGRRHHPPVPYCKKWQKGRLARKIELQLLIYLKKIIAS